MKLKRILALCLALLLFLSGCGTDLNEKFNLADAILPESAKNDITVTEYKLITENNNLSFWFNENTTAFKVVDKSNGFEWYSTENATQKATAIDAPFIISYVNSAGLIETMDAMTASIVDGKYSFKKTKNGLNVIYSLGEFVTELNVPLALTKERKDAIVAKIEDEFVASQFDIMYQFVNIEKLDGENREKFLTKYPKLTDTNLFILRDSIADADEKMKELSQILKDAGYTEEMYREDSQYFVDDEAEEVEKTPQFRMSICYELCENGLKVTVPHKEIQMHKEFPIVEIELLKSFGSPDRNETGYFLLPDGSGSLMNFYNGKGELQPYSVNVYGNDKSAAENEDIYQCDQVYFPVFGIKRENNAVLGVIEKGDAISVINAYPGGEQLRGYAYATFKLRSHYRSYTSANANTSNYFVSLQNERYEDDIVLSYSFLNGDKADYKGMANAYREKLFGNSNKKVSSTALLVECVGLIDKQISVLGFEHTKKVTLTDFKDVKNIADELKNIGFENINIKLSGWAGGGYYGKYAANTKINKELGSQNDLLELNKYLSSVGIGFYPDVDTQYTYKTTLFDKFTNNDIATLISKSKGYLIEYNPATFERDPKYKTPAYINNPSATKRAFDSFFKNYSNYGFNGVSLRNIGSDVNGDYNTENGTSREAAKNMIVNSLSSVSKDYSVLTNGVNAYTLPYVDYCSNIPLTANNRDNTDMSVPFVQMVISGYVGYSGPALNLQGDKQGTILKMAQIGADAYYMVSAKNHTEAANSDYNFIYSSDFSYLKDNINSLALKYQQDMKDVAGKIIVNYEKLSERLYRTTFENGKTVTVNYDYNAVEYDGVEYEARSYKVSEKEADR